jgi:hypothetical protein
VIASLTYRIGYNSIVSKWHHQIPDIMGAIWYARFDIIDYVSLTIGLGLCPYAGRLLKPTPVAIGADGSDRAPDESTAGG